MITEFISHGYPPEYLSAIDLIPNNGANARAATLFIAPAADSLLVRAGRAARGAGYAGPLPQRLDLLGHSMGAFSTRWYAAELRPDRVRTWISLAGANHGTNTLCDYPDGEGNIELCPAFGIDPVRNAVQIELNGTPAAPLDESPFGIGMDRPGVTPILPDTARRILYYSIRVEPDFWIKPESSALIDGAGGIAVAVPAGVPVVETGPGNFLYTGTDDHDNLPTFPPLIRFVRALLSSSISTRDVTVTEGNAGTSNAVFMVTLSAASNQTVTVDYATANGTATAGSDYIATSGTLTFAPGATTQSLTVVVNGDITVESDETLFVNLSNPANATIADNQALGTISNDDIVVPLPDISINDVSVTEGNAGIVNATFNVTLPAASGQIVTADYATANGTATAGSDYVAGSGTLIFAPGAITQSLTVAVNGDVLDEPNEHFLVNLSNATNATITDNQGLATITDDDAAPALAINDVTVTEANSGTVNAVFNVALSAISGQIVTVNYSTANGTATSGNDFAASAGTLAFSAETITQTIAVQVSGDISNERHETFFVNLNNPQNATITDAQGMGTILDDDGPSVRFLALLKGNLEVPPVKTKASGGGTFMLSAGEDTLRFNLRVTQLSAAITGAHFHNAAAGALGPAVRTITANFSGDVASGIWTRSDNEPLTPALVTELLAGNFYVNIRTASNPSGEIRGQLWRDTPVQLFAALSGSQVVSPVETTASGAGSFTLASGGQSLAFDLRLNELSGSITTAHFHSAATGMSGPSVRDLTTSFAGNRASGIWSDTDVAPLTPALVAELLAGTIYADVHTASNPNGEIRGQTATQALPDWEVPITVRPVGSTNLKRFDLAIGGHAAATDSFNLGLDLIAAPPGFDYYSYLALNTPPGFLSRDIRRWVPPFAGEIVWQLQIVNAAGMITELRWDSTAFPLQEAFTLIGAGENIDMRSSSRAQVAGNAGLLIRKHPPLATATFDFPVANGGWYLISLPVVPDNKSAAVLFPQASAVFAWDYATQSYSVTSMIEPGRAYWVNMPSAAQVQVRGVPFTAYTRHYTQQGWDLTGAVSVPSPLRHNPEGTVLAMFRWNAVTQNYAAVDPQQANPKQGYWILIFNAPNQIAVGGTEFTIVDTLPQVSDTAAFYAQYGRVPPPPPSPNRVEILSKIPENYALAQNFPNPFNPQTVIEYQLPEDGGVTLKIYTITGEEVRNLLEAHKAAGVHRVRWDGRNDAGQRVNSGVYIYRITMGEFTHARKLLLLR